MFVLCVALTRASNRKQKDKRGPTTNRRTKKLAELEEELTEVNCCLQRLCLQTELLTFLALHDLALPIEKRHQTTPNLDFLTSERYRRGELDREERFEPEMAQKKRPKRRQKKNRGQRRKRVLWEDKRKARKSYLELKQHWGRGIPKWSDHLGN